MSTVKKLDGKRRAVFPDCFSPGDVFVEKIDDNTITYTLIEPEDVPVADIEERGGKHYVKLTADRELVARAVRKERDSR